MKSDKTTANKTNMFLALKEVACREIAIINVAMQRKCCRSM